MFEKVNPAHPDKVADRIAGALVDLAYEKEADPRIAVEVLIGHGTCHIIAETSVSISPDEVEAVVNRIAGNLVADYREYVTNYIETHPACAVLLDMGLGKTSITLTALLDLLFDTFEAHRILVIAPLRVARDTWPAEIEKWDHLKLLTYSVAVGSEKDRIAALKRPADIYIINRENVQWLVEQSGIPFDFDTVIVDELSSFKSHQSKRFKALMRVRPRIKRIVGLTGTPSANGLMDLWAEFKILDMGERLGRFIGMYRNNYFTPDKRNGQIIYSYKLLPGADKAIYKRISDITISMKAADHLKMPELVMNNCVVELSDDERERDHPGRRGRCLSGRALCRPLQPLPQPGEKRQACPSEVPYPVPD